MGRELLDSSQVFAERVAECAAALEPWVDWSLMDVLRGRTGPELMDRVDVLQPASFAMMVGLAAVWRSCGLRPDAVVGHSQGEIAAACVAGALSLEDAARVVALRSQAIATTLSGRGGMASVALSEDDVVARLVPWADRVQVAAVNGPTSVVIAGDAEALDEALEVLSGNGVRVRRVAVDYASHTRHVEDIHELLAEALADVTAQAPAVPVLLDRHRRLDPGRRRRGRRLLVPQPARPVGFGPAVAALLEQGHGVFVEVSAHPVLVQPISEIVDGTEADVVVAGSLRRDDGGLRRLLTSMAELFVRGVDRGLERRAAGRRRRPRGPADVCLPAPALLAAARGVRRRTRRPGTGAAGHPLLGAVVELPQSDGLVFTSRLSLRSHPWLADHAVGGVVIAPGQRAGRAGRAGR